MTLDVAKLLTIPVFRAMDVDDEGRVLAATDGTGTMQLVEIAPDGTVTQLTALAGACQGRYVPGTRTVLVSHDTNGNERTQLSLLPLSGRSTPAGDDDLEPLVRDERHIHNLVDIDAGRICYLTNRRNGVDFDVVVRDLASGTETVAFDGGGYVSSAAMSPDGKHVVVTRPAIPAMSDQVLLVDLATAPAPESVRPLTADDEPAAYEPPAWSADGDALLVATNRDRDMSGIARHDIGSGEWTWLVTDEHADLSAWPSPTGEHLIVHANVDGAARLAVHDPVTGEKRRDLPLPGVGCVKSHPLPSPVWAPDGRSFLLSFCGPLNPGDVLRGDPASGEVVALTDSAAALAGVPVAVPEWVHVPTPDGERVPCLVYRPTGGDPALHATAVLQIHGGPEGQTRQLFSAINTALALAGHTVIAPNVRGSVGYGKRWYSMDDVRLRLDSVADLAAIHAHLPTLGLDPARAALWGGSYGGYMTLAGLAFQPELWAAGVDIVGVSSLVSFLENTSPYRRSLREREYGSLQHDRDFLWEASPLRRIDDIRAPLFVIHGLNDPRVPVSEAEQLHAALDAKGIPCELRIYPDEGHGLAKHANRLDAYPAAIAFLARHLSAAPASPGETDAGS